MILTLFIVLTLIALILIGLGYATDVPVYNLTGFAFMFLLSVIMLGGNIEYQTGEVHVYNYTAGYCVDNCTMQAVTTGDTMIYSYDYFNDATSRTIGLYLAAASVLGFGVSIASLRTPRGMRA